MVQVKMNSQGAQQLLNSPDMQRVLLEHVQRIADAAGPGFSADVQPGKRRAHGMVKSVTIEGAVRQATDNVLLKAIGAAQ